MVIRRVHSCPPGAHTPEWRTKLQFWGCLVKTKYSLGLSLGILEKMRTFLSRGAGSWAVMLESLSAQPYCFHCSVLQQFCLNTSNPNPNPVGMAGRTEEWKESHRPTWFFFFLIFPLSDFWAKALHAQSWKLSVSKAKRSIQSCVLWLLLNCSVVSHQIPQMSSICIHTNILHSIKQECGHWK